MSSKPKGKETSNSVLGCQILDRKWDTHEGLLNTQAPKEESHSNEMMMRQISVQSNFTHPCCECVGRGPDTPEAHR